MNEHYAKNTKLREENAELANKLKSLIEQYELREQVSFCSTTFVYACLSHMHHIMNVYLSGYLCLSDRKTSTGTISSKWVRRCLI